MFAILYAGNEDMVQLANYWVSVEAQNPFEIARTKPKTYDFQKKERLGCVGKKYVLNLLTQISLAQKYELLF